MQTGSARQRTGRRRIPGGAPEDYLAGGPDRRGLCWDVRLQGNGAEKPHGADGRGWGRRTVADGTAWPSGQAWP